MAKPVNKIKRTRYVFDLSDVLQSVWNILDSQAITVDISKDMVVKGIEAVIAGWTHNRLAYNAVKRDLLEEWCDAVDVALPRTDEDSVHDQVIEHISVYALEELDGAVPVNTWRMHAVHFDRYGVLVVERGPDFRIYDWMKTYRPQFTGEF